MPTPRPRVNRPDTKKVIPLDEKKRPPIKPRPPPRPPASPATERVVSPHQNYGDAVDSLPFYRRNIEDLIKENRPQNEKFEAACNVMKVKCSLNSKYESIELWNLLEINQVNNCCHYN